MKIVFYSTDISIEKFFSSLSIENAILVSSVDEVEKAFSSSDHSIIFLDFDCDELNCADLAIELNVIDNVNTVLLSGKMGLKDIVSFQSSKSACDAYLTKPLTPEILTGVINDFELSLGTFDDDHGSTAPSDNVDLTFVGVKKDLLDQLKSVEVEENVSQVDESEDEEVSENDIFKVMEIEPKEVRDVHDTHLSSEGKFDNDVNDEIQRKFDAVFNQNNEELIIEKKPSLGIVLDHSDEEEFIEENKIIDQVSTEDSLVMDREDATDIDSQVEEVSMADDNENNNGLEFSIPDNEMEEPSAQKDDDVATIVPDESDGLEFNLGENDESLDFSAGEDKSDNSPTESITMDDDLSFDDDSGSLSLSADDGEDTPQIDLEDDSLSFDEEGSDINELDLSESYDGEESASDTSLDDELDFHSDPDIKADEEDVLSFDSEDISDDDFEMGSDTSSDIESTISSIVAPVQSEENATGEFDLSSIPQEDTGSMEEFDYKTSSNYTPGLINDSLDESESNVGENTNPTVIANTSSLTGSDFASSLEEIDEEEESDDEISFGELEESQESPSDFVVSETDFNINQAEFDVTETVAREIESESESESEPVATPVQVGGSSIDNISRNYDEDEMLRLQGTIRQLREERESLMSNINTLTSEKQLLSQDNLGLKAELDEIKIELEIVKKRSHDEISEMKYQSNLSHEKKDIFEMKYKTLYKEFDRLNQKVRIDFNQVKQREKDLESKLELVVMDSDSQVQTRDMKILELKRKIDSLEFNMENTTIREQKHREDKSKLEERLSKIMKTLRGSIQLIEDDLEVLDIDNTNELD